MPVSGAYADPLPAMTDERLRQYLAAATGRQVSRVLTPPEPLPGGIENRNYRVTAWAEGERVCFVLRFPPERVPEWRLPCDPSDPNDLYDLGREYRVLREVARLSPKAPQAWGYDPEGRFFSVPCFVMEYLPGKPLYESFYPDGDPLHPRHHRRAVAAYAQELARLVELPYLASPWLSKHLPRWTSARRTRWLLWQTRRHSQDVLLQTALHWLEQHRPEPGPLVFHHGDPNPTNFLTIRGCISGVVDWEFACLVDDPLEAIGIFFSGYYRGLLSTGLAEEYCRGVGHDARELLWFSVRGMVLDLFGEHPTPLSSTDEVREALVLAIQTSR